MTWVQLPVWSDYLCVRFIIGMCYEISDWQQRLTVTIICYHCWHLNVIRGWACDQVRDDTVQLKTLCRPDTSAFQAVLGKLE